MSKNLSKERRKQYRKYVRLAYFDRLNGQDQALAKLIDMGVDLDAFSSGFYTHATPLHHAVWSRSLDSVKVLAEAGAKLDAKDKANNSTPLGWAEYATQSESDRAQQYAEIAAYLSRQGAV
jgi:hypothetical protein